MGHFSHNCKLTGLPITGGTPVVLIPMVMRKSLYDNSEQSLQKYGSTYMCSNDGPRLKFIPCMFPIIGEYDDYGGIENIVEDDNTKVLENFYGLTIQEIANIITCGRKGDGCNDELKIIKKEIVYPSDWVKGESHFNRFQRLTNNPMPFGDNMYPDVSLGGKKPWTIIRYGKRVPASKEEYDADFKLIHAHYKEYEEWTKTNPNVERDYGNPQYKEKYTDLLKVSGMWIHGDVYNQLTEKPILDPYDKLDLGTEGVLESLGFTKLETESSDKRYTIQYEKDGLIINSDGTWINVPKVGIYTFEQLKDYCKSKGVDIDVNNIITKDRIEQMYDISLASVNKIIYDETKLLSNEDVKKIYDKNKLDTFKEIFGASDEKEVLERLFEILNSENNSISDEQSDLMYYFLNSSYGSDKIKNKLTKLYFNNAKDGKLRDNLVRFWRFDSYMYATGTFYDIVGTGPQDGDIERVNKVLEVASKISSEKYKKQLED